MRIRPSLKRSPKHAAFFLTPALAAAMLLGACGDDDDTEAAATTESPATTAAPDTTAAGGGDTEAFCTSAVALEAAALDSPDGSDDVEANKAYAATLLPHLTDLQANGPDAAQGPLTEIVPLTEAASESGDSNAFQSPEFSAALNELHAAELAECGWATTDVDMPDYHFMGMPDTLPAGVHSFEITNTGKEPHVMDIVRKNDGVTETFDELLALPEEEAMTKVTDVAAGFAAPGTSSYVVADFAPGEYLALCPLPVGWVDLSAPPPDGPPHFVEGMSHQFTVS